MRYDSIKLVGFKRMALNQIQSFELKPTSRVQLILGTNGCGKSSLMGELSPLPAVAANYSKDGSKTISITHRGEQYTLTSTFGGPKAGHSIVTSAGDELNPGGTITVQKELVKQIFGITQDIHDLNTGVEKFSQMSPSRRREWFTQLCDTNYDYALSVYAKFKERLRDTTGALRIAKKRLVTESAKILNQDAVEGIKAQIDALSIEIDLLYRSRDGDLRGTYELGQENMGLMQLIGDITSRIHGLRQRFGMGRMFTVAELQDDINLRKVELIELNTQTAMLSKEHNELKDAFDTYAKSGAAGLNGLKDRLVLICTQRNELMRARTLGLEFSDSAAALSALTSIYEVLHHTFSNIAENRDRRFSSVNLNAAREKLTQIQNDILSTDRIMEEARHRKLHMDQLRNGEKTECPECKHRWVPGYDQVEYDKLVAVLDRGSSRLATLRAGEAEQKQIIEDNSNYGELFKEYARAVRTVPVLAAFWDLLSNDDIVYNSPRVGIVKLDALKRDLDLAVQAAEIDREIRKTQDLIEVAVKASDLDMEKVTTRMEAIEKTLGELATRTSILISRDQIAQTELKRTQEFIELGNQLAQAQKSLETNTVESVKALRNELINSCLKSHQIALAQKQNALNEITTQEGIIDSVIKNIQKLEQEEQVLKLLMSSLSPTDGLIAEGLLGFIRTFVRKMNIVIRRIWSYKMEVQDCSVDSDTSAELDYKFPMIINDNFADPVPDISKGSAGQREVVDLSFKIVAMGYLQMTDYPLQLDEFGNSFDQAHRVNASATIKTILEQMHFTQLWMVSHYADNYGVFTNAEICVMSDTNIVVPERYNEHVVMS